MDAPTLERIGDDYIFSWTDIGFTFDHLRETSDGLHSEITIQGIDSFGQQNGHFHWAKLNLSSTSARSTLAKYMNNRNDAYDWHAMLEYACTKVAKEYRTGTPVVDLSSLPVILEPQYFINKLMPLGETTILFADGGLGKSWFALFLGICVHENIEMPMSMNPLHAGNILYLDWESSQEEMRRRLEWIWRGLGHTQNPPVIYHKDMQRSLVEDAANIRKEIKQLNIKMVILDSIVAACDDDPEGPRGAKPLMNTLRSFTGTSRLAIGHTNKKDAAKTSGAARTYGSVFFENLGRSVWEMRGDYNDSIDEVIFALYHRKCNIGKKHGTLSFKFKFNESKSTVKLLKSDITESATTFDHAPLPDRIRSLLGEGQKLTVGQLVEELGVTDGTVRKALARMDELTNYAPGKGRGHEAQWGFRGFED